MITYLQKELIHFVLFRFSSKPVGIHPHNESPSSRIFFIDLKMKKNGRKNH